MKKRILCAAMASVMVLSLAACAGGAEETTAAETAAAETTAAETTAAGRACPGCGCIRGGRG